LREKDVEVVVARADILSVTQDETRIVVEPRVEASATFGVYLLRSGSLPKLLACSDGSTSPLQAIVPVAAAAFFGYPECVPEEWREIEVPEEC
jgi:hypothetical protein